MPSTSILGNWIFGLLAWVGLFPPTPALPVPVAPVNVRTGAPPAAAAKLPMCGLAPAIIKPNLCVVKYRISTDSPECQAFFDQGLGYFYSYVWMESSRSFETACKCDPDCALAWWGLSRALERYSKPSTEALKKAQALMSRASHREQLLIQARLEEKGILPKVGNAEARKVAATKTIDTLLALYDDDEEGWYYRAMLGGGSNLFGGQVSSVPFYKALLRINPLHPGANHELVHFYENMRRPALGWPYAEKYIESSPGIPHAYHMQAHLATRIGRWDKSTDRSVTAIALERAYQKEMQVKPSQDQQYAHHLEILMRGLIHDGRFAEARQLKQECLAEKIKHPRVWFQLHMAERDFEAAMKIAEAERKKVAFGGIYMAALVYLAKDDLQNAAKEAALLEAELKKNTGAKQIEQRLLEVQGTLRCRQGQADKGLELLAKAVERSKVDYGQHAWGNGAYHMEVWGLAALGCHRFEVAEEAFQEALAHDAGSFHAALGLQVLCEKLGRTNEAGRYAELAQRAWRKAAPSDIQRELELLRNEVGAEETPCGTGAAAPAEKDANWTGSDGNPQTPGAGQEALRSGLQPGERPWPYASFVITGSERGTSHCFVCETADKPAIIIFARTQSEALGKLANGIDKALVKHKDAALRSWITFLYADHTSVDRQIVQWARNHTVATVPLAVFEDLAGPPSYHLSRDADVTVQLAVKQKIVANFAFRAEELKDSRIEEVLKAIAELVKK